MSSMAGHVRDFLSRRDRERRSAFSEGSQDVRIAEESQQSRHSEPSPSGRRRLFGRSIERISRTLDGFNTGIHKLLFDGGGCQMSKAVGGAFYSYPPSSYNGVQYQFSAPSNFGNSTTFFSWNEIVAATNGFSQSNILGEGGFGFVYKGHLNDGQVVAVKKLKLADQGQGEQEFNTEVEIISRIHHRNLVSLVGCCIAGNERLLVYEYVPNGTLAEHLRGKDRPVMSWATRLKIAIGSARGLSYLHEDCHPRIIHRDIKGSNILLDSNFEAKVADFGFAKLTSDAFTHVTTRVVGTFGYLAPEYALSGMLTDKSDVYSFGVVLLELITGKKPVDSTRPDGEENLVEWARPILTKALESKNLEGLVDPKLKNDYDENEMLRVVETVAACVRRSASKRPRMGQILRALESDVPISKLNEGVIPGESVIYGSILKEASDD